MREVNINDVIAKSRFNSFFLGIFLMMLFSIIFDGYEFTVYGTIVPSLIRGWHIGPATAGMLMSYGLFGMLIGAIVFGMIADKIGRKKLLVIGVAIYCVFNGLVGFSQAPTTFAILRFIGGLGLGGVMPCVIALSAEYSPLSVRALMIASAFIGVPLGGITASTLAISWVPTFGWRIMFWVSFVPIILVILLAIYLPESATFLLAKNDKKALARILHRANPDYMLREDDKYVVTATAGKVSLAALFQEGRALNTIFFWIAYFMNLFMIFAVDTWLTSLMMKRGYALGSALWLLLTFNLGSVVGIVLGGRLVESLGYKRVLVLMYILAFVCTVLLIFKSDTLVLTILIALDGFAINGTQCVAHAYVSQTYPVDMRSTAMGWALALGRAGAITAPTLCGILLAVQASLPVIFFTIGIPAIIAALAIGFSRDRFLKEYGAAESVSTE